MSFLPPGLWKSVTVLGLIPARDKVESHLDDEFK